jgi:hypothetical protein
LDNLYSSKITHTHTHTQKEEKRKREEEKEERKPSPHRKNNQKNTYLLVRRLDLLVLN